MRKRVNIKRLAIVLSITIFISFGLGFITGKVSGKSEGVSIVEGSSSEETDEPDSTEVISSMATEVNFRMLPEPEHKQEPEHEVRPQSEWMVFRATAYCPCEKCCGKWAKNRPNGIVYTASGEVAIEGLTVAADWDVLPKGTVIEIENKGFRVVQDKGGAIKGNRIDIYFESHQEALEFGVQNVLVRIIGT